jgi:hypothetical protein
MTYNSQRWNIKISQIECGAAWAAPKGCLQYYTENTDEIKSFNYDKEVHLADQYYDICVRPNAKKCKICYHEAAAGDFQVSAVPNTLNVGSSHMMCNAVNLIPVDLTAAVVAEPMQLGNDWVSIVSGADTTGAIKGDRFCGNVLHADIGVTTSETVCSMMKPFRLGVHFDGSEAAGNSAELNGVVGATTRGDKGFKLTYEQNDC